MPLSIRLRTIITLNAFVIALAFILGWIAQDVAGRVVEERFVRQMVASASGFLRRSDLPHSNVMMRQLRELFNADWISVSADSGQVIGSSLDGPLTEEFASQLGGGRLGVVRLGGQSYRFDSDEILIRPVAAAGAQPARLYMLVADAQFQQARAKVRSQVARVVWPSAAVATALAMLLSFSITRPINRLAARMDRLADAPQPEDQPPVRGPSEIVRLGRSFQALLERLRAARDQVAQSERLATLGKLSLSVAHELRNPLSAIKMNVRILKDDPRLADDEGIEAILREIDRMGLYLNELMSLSPSAAGEDRAEANRSPQRLSELAQSVMTILAGRCRHAGVSVTPHCPLDEPCVIAEPNQLRQVIMNLMVNAIEAMPHGGDMTLRVEPDSTVVRLSVADSGPGVSPARTGLFEAFNTDKPNGVGLGLYISRQIVERHGGKIGYDSTSGGATFWFELPIHQPAGHDEQ